MKEIQISERQKTVLLAIGAAACGQVIVSLLLTILHPAAGEIVQNILIQIGVFITLSLFAALAVLFASVLAWNFKKGIRIEYSTTTGLLSSGAFTEPDISPDRLIMLRPGETDAEYEERVRAEISNACPHRWVVIVPYQYPSGMVYRNPDECMDFARDQPPFQASEIQPGQFIFSQESYSDYVSFLNWFAYYFRDYAKSVKLQLVPENEKSQTFLTSLRAAFLSALFVMLASGLFAQKSAQLRATDIANKIPEAGQNISYVFEKSDIYRTADGRKTYIDLLTSVPSFRDDGGGKLVAVMSGNRSVYKAEQTGDVAAVNRNEIMRGNAETVEGPVNYSLPDSLTTAEMIERGRRQVSFYKTEFWKQVRPVWAFVMYCFWALFPILGIAIVVLRFWAQLSASEEMPVIHWHSSRSLVILVGCTFTVGIINTVLTVVYWELPPVPFILCLSIIGFGAWKAAAFIVPNIQAKPGGRTAFTRTSHLPGLPGGN